MIGVYSISVDSNGNLVMDPILGNGGVVIDGGLSTDYSTVNGDTTVQGNATCNTIIVSQFYADTVSVTESYRMCNSNDTNCIQAYPQYSSQSFVPYTNSLLTCPNGTALVAATVDCEVNGQILNIGLPFGPGQQSVTDGGGCTIANNAGFISCANNGQH